MRCALIAKVAVLGIATTMFGVAAAPAGAKPAGSEDHPPGGDHGTAQGAATTGQHDPAGNNGTVKIDGLPFDDAPNNEPHPGCTFQVDFYGFDAGDLMAAVTFEAVAPTAGDVIGTDSVAIGEDSHAGGGSEAGLDASKTYDLSTALAGITPQPQQGWH